MDSGKNGEDQKELQGAEGEHDPWERGKFEPREVDENIAWPFLYLFFLLRERTSVSSSGLVLRLKGRPE